MRRCVVLLLALAGCGGDDEPRRALPPVQLIVEAPADPSAVDSDEVEVRGRVAPSGARVLVAGDEVGVSSGSWSATVELAPGTNVIDVQAGAPGRPAAMTAVRVERRIPIEIPDVTDSSPDEAVAELEALGLTVRVERAGLLDDLLPGALGVCGTDPGAGESVRSGSEVVVEVARVC